MTERSFSIGHPAAVPVMILVFFGGCFALGLNAGSRDLLALWLAADAWATGTPSGIYPTPTDVFAMRPPEGWYERALELGSPGEIYPYIYAPLWAAVLAPLTKVMSFTIFKAIVFALNAALLLGTAYAAARLAGFRRGATAGRDWRDWMLVSLAMIMVSLAGLIALRQGQIQILVSFLTILALLHAEEDRPLPAGIAMGFAIALKTSPLFIAVIWLVTGHARAFFWALGVGGTLGLLSLLLGGWPLHAQFLALIKSIDQSLLITTVTYSMDTLVGGSSILGTPFTMPVVPPEITNPAILTAVEEIEANWLILVKPAGYAMVAKASLVAAVIVSALILRRAETRGQRAAGWAFTLTALAFFGPIGWAYYYIAPFAFAPLLAPRLGPAWWLLLLAIILAYVEFTKQILWELTGLNPMQTIGFATLAYLLMAGLAAWRRDPEGQDA